MWAGCEQGRAAPLSASFPWLQHFSLQGCQSVTSTEFTAASMTALPRAAGAAQPGTGCSASLNSRGTQWQRTCCCCCCCKHSPPCAALPAPLGMEAVPGTGEKRFPYVSASRDFDPRQLYRLIGIKRSCFSCPHKALSVVWVFYFAFC